MKRQLILWLLPMLMWSGAAQAQSLAGRLVNEKAEPVGFANLVLMNPEDSTFIDGTVSDESGRFRLEVAADRAYLLKASFVGYEACFVECRAGDLGTIALRPSAVSLDEAVVVARLPTFRLKGSRLETNVRSTLLSTVGTAVDVLNHIPGLRTTEEGVDVFGKGTPLIYINNRLMRDKSELERLRSDEIEKVELIRNPGAEYAADVKAVIRIKTVKQAGEGFSTSFRTSLAQSKRTSHSDQLNVSYRLRGLDLFGMVNYQLFRQEQTQWHDIHIEADTLWNSHTEGKVLPDFQTLYGRLGANYEINDRHSAGLSYDGNRVIKGYADVLTQNELRAFDILYDRFRSQSRMSQANRQHKVNAYYTGTFGSGLAIELNADWLNGDSRHQVHATEESELQSDRLVTTDNHTRNRLYAVKLVMKYPLGNGSLSWGGEYSHIRRRDAFDNPQQLLPATRSRIREQKAAAFVEYAIAWGKLSGSAGLRFEHADFDYYDQGVYSEEESRLYDNFFPNLALSFPVGKSDWSLSYSAKTRRPSYWQLRSDVQYDDRFTYEGGNPLLRPMLTHDLTWQLGYRFIQLSASYQYVKDYVNFRVGPYETDPTITLLTHVNYPHRHSLDASLSVSPKISFWEPSLYLYLKKPFFRAEVMGEERHLDRLSGYFSLSNSFRLSRGWVFSLDGSIQTADYDGVMLWRCSGGIDAGLRKSFCNESLTVNLQGFDLFATRRSSSRFYGSDRTVTKWNYSDTRKVSLSISYRFNAARSRYKGTGAANDDMRRF